MTKEEKANVIALAKICGSKENDEVILEKFQQYKNEYLSTTEPAQPAKIEFGERFW